MKNIEYKLARLEEQNAALVRKLRHQENESHRFSVRESQLRNVRRLPLLQKRLDAALTECEELECQLSETRSREAKLSDELKLLRKFVQLSENPSLAETAQRCVKYERIQEDLKSLGEQLRNIAGERDDYKKRALLSCEEAEYYRDKWNNSFEEKKELENYIKKLLAEKETITKKSERIKETSLTATPNTPIIRTASILPSSPSTVEQKSPYEVTEEYENINNTHYLQRSLEKEKIRSEALQETVDALYEQQKEQRRSHSRERRLNSPLASINETERNNQVNVDSMIHTLRQQLNLAEGECTLLTNRWKAIREQNQILLERVSEQERISASWKGKFLHISGECERLKRELDFISQAKSMIFYRHDERKENDRIDKNEGVLTQ